MSKQVKFNLDEEEEIHFKLSVRGSSNLPNVKPVMRFIISENSENGNMSVVLLARPTDDGVVVSIPQLKEFFSEDREYVGKLEIIVGNRYFSPTAMNIGFTRSFDIQAEPVLKEHTASYQVDEIETSGKVDEKKNVEFQVQSKKKPVVKESVKSSIDDIPDEILAALEMELPAPTKKTEPKPVVAEAKKPVKPATPNTKPTVKQPIKKEPAYKAEIMGLFRDALKEK